MLGYQGQIMHVNQQEVTAKRVIIGWQVKTCCGESPSGPVEGALPNEDGLHPVLAARLGVTPTEWADWMAVWNKKVVPHADESCAVMLMLTLGDQMEPQNWGHIP